MISSLEQHTPVNTIPRIQQVAAILWPSFLIAGIATAIFFSIFDPEIILIDTVFANASRLGAYTVGFFLFWLITASSCLLTCYFQKSCALIGGSRKSGTGSS